MTTQYDSASFEADLGTVEEKFKELYKILDSEDFRNHVDATWKNLSNNDRLIEQHEQLMFKLLDVKEHFDVFADRIRDL